ncbi:hypothetical protein P152DRAFT_458561 [Eremomyces bilateralis CBS 781.70]|uniref:UBC core domain-containing protein n=1 Tax=Eremomyces bilateralis CBS 781.70 TaxID=1392243 RepID=A0A6G1G2K3_9PEZI|nr:uncharacterized protein P152DRAFT_458561 [Eremomyces bilateralis CBS 781.70]KAF1812150.1 hypothetical protein P152DRAFT_458561 [Eremomyces bilateralis CBS 781.70]
MPRRKYIEDLKSLAGEQGIPNISGIEAGQDDGTFVFELDTIHTDSPVTFIAQVWPDVSDYPSDHTFKLYTEDDSTPESLLQRLSRLEDRKGLTVRVYLILLSSTLQVVDTDELEYEDPDDEEVDEGHDDIYDDSDGKDRSSQSPATRRLSRAFDDIHVNSEYQNRIGSDLHALKDAGFRVGYTGALLSGERCHVIASIRVARLGISDEAMVAWNLHRSEYLVLLLYFPSGYRAFEDLSRLSTQQRSHVFDLRVGLCKRYKPDDEEIINVFSATAAKAGDDPARIIRNCFISKPIEEMLRTRLFTLVSVRQNCGFPCSWDLAQHGYNLLSTAPVGQSLDYHTLADSLHETPPLDLSEKHLPAIILRDHLSSPKSQLSLPLLVMQCLVRHLVLCTSHCMICWKTLNTELEAIKPYVCDAPLCLYQYLQFGFGPSIEEEIVKQPFVVDLLISFCYSRALYNKLQDFPSGLNLRVPNPQTYERGTEQMHDWRKKMPYEAKLDLASWTLSLEPKDSNRLKENHWIVLCIQGRGEFVRHCRVVNVADPNRVQLAEPPIIENDPIIPLSGPLGTENDPVVIDPRRSNARETGTSKGCNPLKVKFALYDHNFDDIPEHYKRLSLLRMMDLIPPVLEMRKHLLESRSTIAQWTNRLPPASIQILRWIIVSCRACIFQVDNLIGGEEKKGGENEERLLGMPGWLQFRFAMGAPDKEQRFLDQVEKVSERLQLNHKTFFAWHGSPVENWHSIIREGLHYNSVVNGRAYGDGCYHSLDFNVSQTYANVHRSHVDGPKFNSPSWTRSALHIRSAMSLNQIVNAPQEFVSSSPHLVVQHVDWIQTRYLFVRGVGNIPGFTANGIEKSPDQVFEQDPLRTPAGEIARVVIPYSAVHRAEKFIRTSSPGTSAGKKQKNGNSRYARTQWEEDSEASENEDQVVAGIDQPEDMMRYEPGKLNAKDLPLIVPPEYATPSASKSLMRDLRETVDLQKLTVHHALGWTVSEDLRDDDFNLYQWIVELHSFPLALPLAHDMKKWDIQSIVLEMRFAEDYPFSPPFIRVIRPRFLPFAQGGGGHVTAGGAICMELLTQSGWSSANSIESILLQVRMAIMSLEPRPARLHGTVGDYSAGEAVEAYRRACMIHGWKPPPSFEKIFMASYRESARGYATAGASRPMTPKEVPGAFKE